MATNKNLRIILASQSKIRKRALDILSLAYEVIPANIDEKSIRDTDPLKMALNISVAKARAVASKEDGVIIASDAFLFFNGNILEKPNSLTEAHTTLKALSENKHTFITGLAVYDTLSGKMYSCVSTCDITFRKLFDDEIKDYCNQYPVLTLAGALEFDGIIRFSKKIDGNCNFVTAMPMNDLIHFLREIKLARKKMSERLALKKPELYKQQMALK